MPADILDPTIKGMIADFDEHRVILPLSPSQWAAFPPGKVHAWVGDRYTVYKANSTLIPKVIGVYAFVVRPEIAGLQVSYLLYIGKTEAQDMRTRFKQYVREHKKPKGRHLVRRMLDRWENNLWFHFAQLPVADVAQAEIELLSAFLPPSNTQFEATVKAAVTAFRN